MNDRPDWSGESAGALVPVDDKPAFSQEDLSYVDDAGVFDTDQQTTRNMVSGRASSHEGLAHQQDDGEDETVVIARQGVASGHLSIDEAQRIYGLTDAEVEAIQKPAPTRRSEAVEKPTVGALQRELKAIEAKRQADRAAYFRDERLQARERELISALDEALKARAEELQVPVAELGLPKKLLENWEETGGVEHNLEAAREAGQAALDDLDEAEQAELSASVDALPTAVQVDLYGFLSIDAGKWRAARAEEVQRFAKMPEGADLISEWGNKAAQKIGNVQARISMIEERLSAEDRAKAQDWLHGLPPNQLKSVLRSIAGR